MPTLNIKRVGNELTGRNAKAGTAAEVTSTKSDCPETNAAGGARLDALLHQYGALLRQTIARVCPPGVSCDDVEQEARISLWKALRGGGEIAFPVSYVRKVAISVTLRAIRRAKARREESLPEEGERHSAPADSPYAAAERHELRQTIAVALRRLPQNRRLAVSLHLKGLTTSEIGTLLNWSEPKARNLVHRGLRDLRISLRGLGVEYGS
jgi:RNA polymerase sigma factor (sigma-70 family)